jgi:ABC-2 type transport system ATP-binding protein
MLELDGLSKRYGNTVALDRLSFSVAEGQVFGFVGPNGSGKTTAMRIVLGVLAADAGEVRWRGVPLDEGARRRIGYMPEERGLYPKMRAGSQLTYLAELHGLDAVRARRNTEEWTGRLGLSDRRDSRVEELSLGNQQRVQLAAALVHEPDLLVLDEPFSGLDPVGVDVLSDVLIGEAHRRRVPVVFSSHQLELVERLCDAVAIIHGGRLVASGGVDELKRERAGRRWRLELAGDGSRPVDVAGARPLGENVYALEPDADPQALLDAGRDRATVVRFGPETPSLAELFRDVARETVAAEGDER